LALSVIFKTTAQSTESIAQRGEISPNLVTLVPTEKHCILFYITEPRTGAEFQRENVGSGFSF
jgi:hypothetical protein